jgi:hypothetical protein
MLPSTHMQSPFINLIAVEDMDALMQIITQISLVNPKPM